MTNKKDGSEIENNSDTESSESFDAIFSKELDDAKDTPSRKSPSLNNSIKGVFVRFFNYIKKGKKQDGSNAETRDIMCRLNIVDGPLESLSFEIKKDVTLIGRANENDIEINDRKISRRHIKITKKNNKFFIEDLGSYNGLKVDGTLVRSGEEIELMDGTDYSIGDTVFRIERIYLE
jgi:hypothetical protein